ncbi:hypothetical protein SRHO_G00313540 [Serrasalmus rhombeus]
MFWVSQEHFILCGNQSVHFTELSANTIFYSDDVYVSCLNSPYLTPLLPSSSDFSPAGVLLAAAAADIAIIAGSCWSSSLIDLTTPPRPPQAKSKIDFHLWDPSLPEER